jgi:hypothetical protein
MLLFPLIRTKRVAVANCTFLDHETATATADSYTFANGGGGYALSGYPHVIVAGVARSASTFVVDTSPAPTIGGVNATILFNAQNGGDVVFFLIAANPADGDIVVPFTGDMVRCAISIYPVTGLLSTTPLNTPALDTSDPHEATLDVTAGGFVIGAIFATSTPTSPSWTNLDEDIEVLAAAWENDGNFSTAHRNFATAQTGLAVAGDWGGATTREAGAFLAMR